MKTEENTKIIEYLNLNEIEPDDYPHIEEIVDLLGIGYDYVRDEWNYYASELSPENNKPTKDELSNDWINEILDKTHDFAKQLIKNHFERHPQSSPSPAEITEEVPTAFEWHNYETGHAYVDYVPRANMTDQDGYTKIPLYAFQQPKREVSDEEIEEWVATIDFNRLKETTTTRRATIYGAKWMRNRLTGTNKE